MPNLNCHTGEEPLPSLSLWTYDDRGGRQRQVNSNLKTVDMCVAYVRLSVYVYACSYVCTHAYLCKPEVNTEYFPLSLSVYFSNRASSY